MNSKREKDENERVIFFHTLYHSILKPKSASPYDEVLKNWEIKDKKESEK